MVGPSWIRTFCRFGFQRRRVARKEWLRALPKPGRFPHEEQTFATINLLC